MLLGNLFTDKALVILCILRSKKQIQLIFLLDTSAIGIAFIDEAITCTVCKKLEIFFIKLAKSKPFKKFDSRLVIPITHAIYPILTMQNYIKQLALMLMTKLGQYLIILGKL